MSSDDYFDDDFNDADFAQLDAIEAAALAPKPPPSAAPVPTPAKPPPRPLAGDSSIEMSFDIDVEELAKIDEHVTQQYNQKVLKVVGPSNGARTLGRTSSSTMLQTTLFGDILPSQQASSSKEKSQSTMQRTNSAKRSVFGQQAPKTKTWDHTAFAESGMKRTKSKGKGKADDENSEDDDGFELPPPFMPSDWVSPQIGMDCVGAKYPYTSYHNSPPPPMKLKPDLLEAKHWIFPINRAKRDYQYNIVKNCFFDNTLVALPTGLGKTFVAGVVMLNFYRWFPEGQIVFVAPTKPLVAQQITASHETCGIPGTDAIELTGQVQSANRSRYWQQKRVFYMTPQTLESDLISGVCDPTNIILLVVDEAHHATGDYSYNKIVRFLMAKNPHFRLLALTATPGNSPEAVQRLIDGLHISHIEIRNENSLDLKPYIFDKVVKSHVIKPTGDVLELQQLFLNVMEPLHTQCKNAGLFYPSESALTLHPFRPQRLAQDRNNPNAGRFYSQLMSLASLARGLLYLVTGSIDSSHEYLEEVRQKDSVPRKNGKERKNALSKNPEFQALMKKFETIKAVGATSHPKMEKLKDILIGYFGSRMQELSEDGGQAKDDTRVMVFSSYRAVVEEIIQKLDEHRPLIRAAAFVGQSADKKGRKGLKQKEQIELIERFQRGEFNVLVATSIGEEGLDIGEIDLTICYDTDKAPTRMIQRFGRTGRKRAGEVHALLAESREEFNLEKAKGTYKEVQKVIDRGELYELYGDVPRLLPENIKPVCIEKEVEMQHYVRENSRGSRTNSGAGPSSKRKRNTDVNRNIPPDMSAGFTSASSVWKKFKKQKVEDLPIDDEELAALGEDDDDDREIEEGNIFGSVRRTQSERTTSTKKAGSPKLKRAESAGKAKTKPKDKGKALSAKAKIVISNASLEELEKLGEDDEDDLEIERGILPILKSKRPKLSSRTSTAQGASSSKAPRPTSRSKRCPSPVLETDESDSPPQRPHEFPVTDDGNHVARSPSPLKNADDFGWLVANDSDDDPGQRSPPLFPVAPSPQFDRLDLGDDSIEITQAFPSQVASSLKSSKGKGRASHTKRARSSSPDIEFVSPIPPIPRSASFQPASRLSRQTPEPDRVTGSAGTSSNKRKKGDMLPPPVPPAKSTPTPTFNEPEPTFFVQKPKRRRVLTITSSDAEEEEEQPYQKRLHRRSSSPAGKKPPKQPKTKRAKPSIMARDRNIAFDAEAAHSGDEVSEGYSEDEEERSSDRDFLVGDGDVTQASPSYEQTQIYRQSLFTQAPMGDGVPLFAGRPVRARPFGRIEPARRGWLPSSSPPPADEEQDEYEFGSFVVNDEDEVVMDDDQDSFLDF